MYNLHHHDYDPELVYDKQFKTKDEVYWYLAGLALEEVWDSESYAYPEDKENCDTIFDAIKKKDFHGIVKGLNASWERSGYDW